MKWSIPALAVLLMPTPAAAIQQRESDVLLPAVSTAKCIITNYWYSTKRPISSPFSLPAATAAQRSAQLELLEWRYFNYAVKAGRVSAPVDGRPVDDTYADCWAGGISRPSDEVALFDPPEGWAKVPERVTRIGYCHGIGDDNLYISNLFEIEYIERYSREDSEQIRSINEEWEKKFRLLRSHYFQSKCEFSANPGWVLTHREFFKNSILIGDWRPAAALSASAAMPARTSPKAPPASTKAAASPPPTGVAPASRPLPATTPAQTPPTPVKPAPPPTVEPTTASGPLPAKASPKALPTRSTRPPPPTIEPLPPRPDPQEEVLTWKEGVVLCSKPTVASATSTCHGPLQTVDGVLGKPSGTIAVNQACGNNKGARELGTAGVYLAFGCGYGTHPEDVKGRHPGNRDVPAMLGVDFVSGRGQFHCKRRADAYCRITSPTGTGWK